MAYGFNNDKSKAQVLTAGEIKTKYINLPVNDTVLLGPGESVPFTFNVVNQINLNKVIGIVGIVNNLTVKNVIVNVVILSTEFNQIYIELLNTKSSDARFTGSLGIYLSYIDQ